MKWLAVTGWGTAVLFATADLFGSLALHTSFGLIVDSVGITVCAIYVVYSASR